MENNSTFPLLLRSRTNWPPESFHVALTLAVMVGADVALFLPGVVYLVLAVLLGAMHIDQAHPERIPAVHLILAQAAGYIPLAAYLLIVLPSLAQRSLHDLGIRVPTWRELGTGAVGAAVMLIVVLGSGTIIESVTHLHDTEAAITLLKSAHTVLDKALFITMVVFLAPPVEELTFRVLAYNAFARWTPVGIAALCSGLLFGAAHAAGQPLTQLVTVAIPLALGGTVLALVYARTGCFWANCLTHALFNSFSVVAYFGFHVKP